MATNKKENRCPTHPGILLAEDILPALDLSVAQAADALQVSRTFLYRLLAGQTPMSMEMCVKVGKLAGNGPRLWANMQTSYDLWQTENDPDVIKAVRKIPTFEAA
ncbi:MAG: HigA family addiction module antidote protein [Alphaproteobacteria bacterium]|nr:HigA family addiction module antidote protein [Alphaproteobacteria bacterium]